MLQPYMVPVDGVYNSWRVSLQTTTLANAKLAVDKCIENYGCLTFYGHAWAVSSETHDAIEYTADSEVAQSGELVVFRHGLRFYALYYIVRTRDYSRLRYMFENCVNSIKAK